MSAEPMSATNAAKAGLRWAFDFRKWKPNKAEWMLAAQCIQPEEKSRIGRFVFKVDAKAAMGGRLLLRKAIAETLNIPYKKVILGRTEKGKPYLLNEKEENLSFNVSHQGCLATLAAERNREVGIDVMEITQPRGSKSVAEFFDTMRRQFTEYEWATIKEPSADFERLARFYRFWCLKESYVKAVGIGIGFSLQRLSFKVNTKDLQQGHIVNDTILFVDGNEETSWEFEETLADPEHCVAVALQDGGMTQKTCDNGEANVGTGLFQVLSFQELIHSAQPCSEPDLDYWEIFNAKDESPG